MTLDVTRGSDWRARQRTGVVLQLPSGMVARVRGVQPDVIVRSGRIPDSLTPVIQRLMDGEDMADWQPQTIADLQASTEFMRAICESALLEPRIVADPTADDEIAYDDLEYGDKVFLLGLFLQPLRQLERFRLEQTGAVERVGAPKRNRQGRQRPAANPPVGGADDGP